MSDYGEDFAADDDEVEQASSPHQASSPPPTINPNATTTHPSPSGRSPSGRSPSGRVSPTPVAPAALITSLQNQLEAAKDESRKTGVELKKARTKINVLTEKGSKQEDLGKEILAISTKLVEESQRSVKINERMETEKSKNADMTSEATQFRNLLFSGINGGVGDTSNYGHVSLSDLLRLRLQEADHEVAEARRMAAEAIKIRETQGMAPTMTQTLPRKEGGGGNDAANDGDTEEGALEIQGVQKLEAEVASFKAKNRALQGNFDKMEGRLGDCLDKIDTLSAVAAKNSLLVERSRTEKDLRGKCEQSLKLSNKKVEALSDHIEKLMLHLKHEATSKAKAFSTASRATSEVELLRARNGAIMKKNGGRERVIVELKEGAKILEDQLRLMDEKYMELRTKLDWTRLQSERTVKKKEEEARSLRSKFALVQGATGMMLDEVQMEEDENGNMVLAAPESPSVGGGSKKGKKMRRSSSHA